MDSKARAYIVTTILFLLLLPIVGCDKSDQSAATAKAAPAGPPKKLDYATIAALVTDMKSFATAIQSRDQNILQQVNNRYSGQLFELDIKPLLYNVYPDPTGKAVVFLIYPKDPRTGSDYKLQFDHKIEAVNSETIELQIRTKDPNTPLNCIMNVPDAKSYVKEYDKHDILAHYTLSKQFLQSGTYDFDALLYPSYRLHGYPFIVMDLMKTELTDRTVNASTTCRQ
jgi:hypothetical protein